MGIEAREAGEAKKRGSTSKIDKRVNTLKDGLFDDDGTMGDFF